MHTVCETSAFQSAAEEAGMTRDEIDRFIEIVAADPEAGDVMKGTGGCRKVRFGGRGKGKSGGYRIVTFFTGKDLPVFLLTVFGKGEQANLTKAERNALAALTKILVSEYRNKIVAVGATR
ncbi:type II toxin-antitoxin system RelE/ParE family toxin [Methylovirgula sp. HY1]|uniref:type II toxin-antitoxin system RelE/ParE family toxin n=1 Tax=Methylovirgula sp. HY1 TaxID=2822761 RepID=UPI001C5AC685|nr:type II toxin-antitoxin system RelE/ParE family toxin [Methylovirgula sp. HY1]QXX74478.1 Toxin HigB-2 [Methylovirgula sp. HY1]